jgi:hypothetical protein
VKVDTKANDDCPAPSLVLTALTTDMDCPPPEHPPQDLSANDFAFDINAMLECIPHEDQDAFA